MIEPTASRSSDELWFRPLRDSPCWMLWIEFALSKSERLLLLGTLEDIRFISDTWDLFVKVSSIELSTLTGLMLPYWHLIALVPIWLLQSRFVEYMRLCFWPDMFGVPELDFLCLEPERGSPGLSCCFISSFKFDFCANDSNSDKNFSLPSTAWLRLLTPSLLDMFRWDSQSCSSPPVTCYSSFDPGKILPLINPLGKCFWLYICCCC